MVGDSGKPDVFFVCDQGVVVTVTRHFPTAYSHWQHLLNSRHAECSIENRNYGVICSLEPASDAPGARLQLHDDSAPFLRR